MTQAWLALAVIALAAGIIGAVERTVGWILRRIRRRDDCADASALTWKGVWEDDR